MELKKTQPKHLVLSLVSLILDLGKYVVLEDGMGEGGQAGVTYM